MSVKSEQEFFDETYESGLREQSVGQIYSITHQRVKDYEDLIYGDAAGARVLEYGCGMGGHSLEIAERGGKVTGIDISEVGIKMAQDKADERGFTDARFLVMDAENLDFPPGSFDLVIGEGILHHLDLHKSYREISRVLAPGGRAVFMEPLGHNIAMNLFRARTPHLRTPDEHPLVKPDLKLAREFFGECTFRYYHLTSFGALALLKTRLFWPAVHFLDKVDRFLFRAIPPLGLQSWYSIMILAKPRLADAQGPGAADS